jgi:hypothetical protein
MASIEELIRDADPYCDSVRKLQANHELLNKIAEPLVQSGFKYFKFVAQGTESFIFAPTDNDKIVFRVSVENHKRRNDVPFFLASPYEHSVKQDADTIKLEVLLAGKRSFTTEQKSDFIQEMKKAGWWKHTTRELFEHSFWNDVITIQMRKDGRIKAVPIISDPSAARSHLLGVMPDSNINTCSSNYITMQDQADAYNNAIAEDPRLKYLSQTLSNFLKPLYWKLISRLYRLGHKIADCKPANPIQK